MANCFPSRIQNDPKARILLLVTRLLTNIGDFFKTRIILVLPVGTGGTHLCMKSHFSVCLKASPWYYSWKFTAEIQVPAPEPRGTRRALVRLGFAMSTPSSQLSPSPQSAANQSPRVRQLSAEAQWLIGSGETWGGIVLWVTWERSLPLSPDDRGTLQHTAKPCWWSGKNKLYGSGALCYSS